MPPNCAGQCHSRFGNEAGLSFPRPRLFFFFHFGPLFLEPEVGSVWGEAEAAEGKEEMKDANEKIYRKINFLRA